MGFYESYTTDWSEDSLRIIHTPSMTAKSSFFYIQEAGRFQTRPGYYTERCRLPSYLLLYTLSGRGSLRYGEKDYALAPESLMYIDCMEAHSYRPAGPAPWSFYWVHFYGATSDGYYKLFHNAAPPVVENLAESRIPALMEGLVESNRTTGPSAELENARKLLELITEIILAAAPDYAGGEMPAGMREVAAYMERHYGEPLTLDRLAQRFSLSKYHLARAFKQAAGVAPGEYLIRLRMNRAQDLLKNSDLPLSEVAAAVGVSSQNHFYTLFKSRTGHSPSEYRKLWRSR
ncbi:MAG: AraC family transcriptional regulator [Clostridiales bacterium]|nr:AraC family transcriptional regulator [Clostridiales bacterium]